MIQHYYHNVKSYVATHWISLVIRCISLAVLVSMLGCAAAPPKADPLPQVVQVPVITPCLDKLVDRPVFMTDAQMLDGSDYQVVVNLRLDRDQRRVYEGQLEAAEQACIKPLEQTK